VSLDPVVQTRAGPVLRVRVKPRAPRDAVTGADDHGLRVEVRASPERGKANEAVCRTVARWLGMRPSDLSIASGASARDKRVAVAGLAPAALRARVAERLGGQ
jgi:hypothetical protein